MADWKDYHIAALQAGLDKLRHQNAALQEKLRTGTTTKGPQPDEGRKRRRRRGDDTDDALEPLRCLLNLLARHQPRGHPADRTWEAIAQSIEPRRRELLAALATQGGSSYRPFREIALDTIGGLSTYELVPVWRAFARFQRFIDEAIPEVVHGQPDAAIRTVKERLQRAAALVLGKADEVYQNLKRLEDTIIVVPNQAERVEYQMRLTYLLHDEARVMLRFTEVPDAWLARLRRCSGRRCQGGGPYFLYKRRHARARPWCSERCRKDRRLSR